LRHRLASVRSAKTGIATDTSALSAGSGWSGSRRGEFSIPSRGMPKYRASDLEDKIVRILQNQAR
jgi:hypothetical protein